MHKWGQEVQEVEEAGMDEAEVERKMEGVRVVMM